MLLSINTTACDGSDVFWPWFLWLLGAFILGLILGWLLKQLFGGKTNETVVTPLAPVDTIKDDLTKIEGIGPKIQGLLNNDGIWSYNQLSLASISRIKKILDDAGPSYTMHNPRTWAAQSRLAEENLLDELKVWQDHLKGGV
jgi:hypothetical protein